MTLKIILLVIQSAIAANVPVDMFLGISFVESRFRNIHNYDDNGSPSYGPMQIKLLTARIYSSSLTRKSIKKAEGSVILAALHLNALLSKYNTHCALAAYNAGSCIKNKKGYLKNQKYIKKVYIAMGNMYNHLTKRVSKKYKKLILKLLSCRSSDCLREKLCTLEKAIK